jgi:hypothetical protein
MAILHPELTIYDLVTAWSALHCGACGMFVDVAWVEPSQDGWTFPPLIEPASSLCPECYTKSMVPEVERARWAAGFSFCRDARAELGLVDQSLAPFVRLTGMHDFRAATLYVLRFAGHGEPTAGFEMDTFALEATELLSVEFPGRARARFPQYWGPPALDTTEAVVFIGANVWEKRTQDAFLPLRWNPRSPGAPLDLTIRGASSLTREQRIRLMEGYTLIEPVVRHSPHRPPGTGNFAPNEEERALESLNQFLEEKERHGVKITSVEMLADMWGVLGRSQTFDLFTRFPRVKERWRQHKQKPRRHP